MSTVTPLVSILIVTHNSGAVLPACLDSIGVSTAVAHEVIAVDNASTDGPSDQLRAGYPSVVLVENQANKGFAVAANQASRLARGRYLLFLNPDTIVLAGAIDRLVDHLSRHPTVGICAPRLITGDGRIRRNCFPFETPWSFFWAGIGVGPLLTVRRMFSRRKAWNVNGDDIQSVEAVTGGALMISADLFRRLGGLDEGFFMYCEDTDLCWRTHCAGLSIAYVPYAVIVHLGGGSTPPGVTRLNGMIGRHLLASRYRYTNKYWGKPAMWGLRLANWVAGAAFMVAALPLREPRRTQALTLGRLLCGTPLPGERRIG